MPVPIVPQNQWETDFEGPLPGEPGLAGAFRTLIQRILNRTERLKNRIADILGTAWDATPPDTLAGLAGRVSTLEGNQGGTSLSAHRSAPVLDHPDGSVTAAKLAPGSVVGHLGYTPLNKAGDVVTGDLTVNGVLRARYDHANRFTVSGYSSMAMSLPPGDIRDLSITRIHIPANRGLYIRRVRYHFSDPLRLRITAFQLQNGSPRAVWVAGNNDMDTDVNFLLFSDPEAIDLILSANNVGSSSQTLLYAQGAWVEFEIR